MPLASWYSLHFYGEAAGAMVTQGQGSLEGDVRGRARAAQVTTGVGSMPRAKATRLVNSPATITGVVSMPRALPKGRARPQCVIKVNELSQDDVTGAVLEAVVEGTVTLRQALRLVLAYAAGDATGLDSNPAFKSLDGSKTRVAGNISGGTRTITTLDPE